MTDDLSLTTLSDTDLEALKDDRETLHTVLMERLEPPDLELVKVLSSALRALGEVDAESAAMSNDDTGEDNRSAVRAISKDVEAIANSVDDALGNAVDKVLVVPFREAMGAARTLGLGVDEWSPQAWLDAAIHPAVHGQAYGEMFATIMRNVTRETLPVWYDLVRDRPAMHHWTHWTRVLPTVQYQPALMNDLLVLLMNDDQVQRPSGPRGKPDLTVPLDEFKRQSLARMAWSSLTGFSSASEAPLRQALWAHVPPAPEAADWNALMVRLVDATRSLVTQAGTIDAVDPVKLDRVLDPVRGVLATGALNDWLGQPSQWAAVDPASVSTNPLTIPRPVTWSGLAASLQAAGYEPLAQRFKTLGESFDLRNTFESVENAPDAPAVVARDRARL